MFTFFLVAIAVFALTATLVYNLYILETILNNRPLRIGYVPSNLKELGPILHDIITRNIPDPNAVELVEPGAGLATISSYLSSQFRFQRVTAVELRYTLCATGWLRAKLLGLPLRFVRQNLFSYAYPRHSVVYCYLSPSIMKELYGTGKLKETLVISLSFPIAGIVPEEHIQLKNWQHELFVYDFRTKEKEPRKTGALQ